MQIVDVPPSDPRVLGAVLPVLQELRPHLTPELLAGVAAEANGPAFLAAFDDERCLGVAGWRILTNTHRLKVLYVDDLVTTGAARSTGVGAALLGELEVRGRAAGCRSLELDSGVQRHGAHRFYLRERFDISSHHFAKPLA